MSKILVKKNFQKQKRNGPENGSHIIGTWNLRPDHVTRRRGGKHQSVVGSWADKMCVSSAPELCYRKVLSYAVKYYL